MEAMFFKLATDYGMIGVATLFLFIAHRQALKELKNIKESNDKQNGLIEKLTTNVTKLNTYYEKHSLQLAYGDKEFVKIEEHQKSQDENIHNLRHHVHTIKNEMLSRDHVELIVESKINELNKKGL